MMSSMSQSVSVRSLSLYLGPLIGAGLITFAERYMRNSPLEKRVNKRLSSWFSRYTEVRIYEFDDDMYSSNETYKLVENHIIWLFSKTKFSSAHCLQLSQDKGATSPTYKPNHGELIEEKFEGATFNLECEIEDEEKSSGRRGGRTEGIRRYFTITTRNRHKSTVLPRYIEYVIEHGKALQRQRSDRSLFTNMAGNEYVYEFHQMQKKPWRSIPFKHASSFDTIALPEKLKKTILEDLDAFKAGEEFFRRVGRSWKRGYLLEGPPGTGKSSLIAAIANYMQYDVYDMELTEVKSNAHLRQLLMGVDSKSITVIEDIDCSLELKKRGKPAPEAGPVPEDEDSRRKSAEFDKSSRVTLSGLLNFVDGLWSCIGDERIIIFTTNHKDQLDPALVRPGRMDLHISLGYCCAEAFRVLAWTYLGLREHRLFEQIDGMLNGANISPGDVAEILIQNRDDKDAALEKLKIKLESSPSSATCP